MKKLLLLSLCCLLFSAVAFADGVCQAGTFADVIGSSCTIGNLSFTFTNFNGYSQYTDLNNNLITNALDPNSIQFVPVISGTQQGFEILPGWTDSPSQNSWFFSMQDANFNYSVTALNGALLTGASAQLVGSIANTSDTGAIATFDSQNFTAVGGSLSVYGNVNYVPSLGSYDQPFLSYDFAQYGLPNQAGSDISNPGTHSLYAFAYTTQSVSLVSDTILYQTTATAPVPEPSSMMLLGSGLVGVLGFFRKKQLK